MNETLAEDWVALWQSELTAMIADREVRESWAAMLTLWASSATTALSALKPRHDRAPGSAVTPQPAGAAAAAAASVARLDEVTELNRRIAELERRLAAFERGAPAGG